MSSTYTFYPPGPDPTAAHRDRLEQPRNGIAHDAQHSQAYHGHLSPFSPQLASSSSASPALNTNTPAESVSTLSVHYQSSEYSEGDDPFFGVNFNTTEGASPSFLDDDILQFDANGLLVNNLADTQHVPHQTLPYAPLSPDKSPSLTTGSPNGQTGDDTAARGLFSQLARTSVAPHELSLTHESSPAPLSSQTDLQLTPRTGSSISPSDDDPAPAATMQSPRVTVSHWDRDNVSGIHPSTTEPAGYDGPAFSAARDETGRWVPDQLTGQRGLDPSARSDAQVDSINDLAAQRKLSDSNKEVDGWLERTAPLSQFSAQASEQTADLPNDGPDNISPREISMGNETENKPVSGQTYYLENGGPITGEDLEIMRQGRNWDNAPVPFSISQPDSASYQPQTSQAAMEKYQRMCRDNDSIVSRAATWGTRRLSLPSILDAEVQLAGNLLKKLSLSKGDARRPSILEGLRGLVRRPSANAGKRSRADADDASPSPTESLERKETQAKLAPPSPKPGWPRKQTVPSINTAFVEVGSAVASIATAHARSGSISATPIASPRSPSGRSLSVKRPLNRLRSKSETSGIVEMWKKSGGPPVSNLGGQRVPAPEADDDEDDDDDLYEDGDLRAESDRLIDDVEPNFQGFQQHLLKLNPMLASTNNYLVDRIAHAQVTRYKALCQGRIKHLQAVNAKNCTSGSMCIALGGSANVLDSKGDQRGLDPLSARYEGSDGDATPLEGAINPDSFPQDIPMPPTGSLPAEFECQLCFNAKKFNKPSDWTKHVHEDVQPFTCTWDRCKDHKMFKRKADWVRHENEGHRHLEWWTCDVDDCRHRCYRRDNFLQHLVREHKFIEPKVKTKAAIKRAGGNDPTWTKVEACHQETTQLPQQEPCRFCGKTFPTWKKLTVHLAKHMEHISLPVLKLVAKKELDEDTIISPVQDPPPRTFPPTYPARHEQRMFGPSPTIPQGPMSHQPGPALAYPSHAPHQPHPLGMFPLAPPQGYTPGLYNPGYDDLATTRGMAQPPQLAMPSLLHQPHHDYQSLNAQATSFPSLPVTSAATAPGGYMPAPMADNTASPAGYMTMPPDLEPFPALDMAPLGLGLQDAAAAAQIEYDVPQQHGLPVVTAEYHYQHQQQGRQQEQQLGQGQGEGQGPQQLHRQFSPQGSVSPYGHSPNPSLNGLSLPQQGGGGFY